MLRGSYQYNETERLDLVEQLEIAGTANEPALSALAAAAATICRAPISLVTVLDETTQWFIAQVGLEPASTPREQAFCHVAIRQPAEILEVPDTWLDPRFKSNPLVTSDPHIRFYAGVPIRPLGDHAVGTLCIISDVPRQLTDSERDALRGLGSVAEELFRLRLEANTEYHLRVSAIQGLAHDLSAPLASIRLTAESLATQRIGSGAEHQVEQLTVFARAAEALVGELRGVDHDLHLRPLENEEALDLGSLIEDVVLTVGAHERIAIDVGPVRCRVDPRVVVRSLSNLVNNALIHTAAPTPITISSRVTDNDLTLIVEDEGPGLPDEVAVHIRTYGQGDHIPATPGLGLGIIVAHSLARTYDGSVRLESPRGSGTRIAVDLPGVVVTPLGEG